VQALISRNIIIGPIQIALNAGQGIVTVLGLPMLTGKVVNGYIKKAGHTTRRS